MTRTVTDTAQLLSTTEVAALLKCHPITVYRHVKDGRLKSVRVGRLMRFRQRDVDAYILANGNGRPK